MVINSIIGFYIPIIRIPMNVDDMPEGFTFIFVNVKVVRVDEY